MLKLVLKTVLLAVCPVALVDSLVALVDSLVLDPMVLRLRKSIKALE
jgi:hypothetical protein